MYIVTIINYVVELLFSSFMYVFNVFNDYSSWITNGVSILIISFIMLLFFKKIAKRSNMFSIKYTSYFAGMLALIFLISMGKYVMGTKPSKPKPKYNNSISSFAPRLSKTEALDKFFESSAIIFKNSEIRKLKEKSSESE